MNNEPHKTKNLIDFFVNNRKSVILMILFVSIFMSVMSFMDLGWRAPVFALVISFALVAYEREITVKVDSFVNGLNADKYDQAEPYIELSLNKDRNKTLLNKDFTKVFEKDEK